MEELNRDILNAIAKKTGVRIEKIDRIIGTLEISLARQAAKDVEKRITLNQDRLLELEESVRIGADITPSEARQILDEVQNTIRNQKVTEVKFLDEGTFEIKEGIIKFRLDE